MLRFDSQCMFDHTSGSAERAARLAESSASGMRGVDCRAALRDDFYVSSGGSVVSYACHKALV
jgi:hypothetical protein